jgi:hypothetical protein
VTSGERRLVRYRKLAHKAAITAVDVAVDMAAGAVEERDSWGRPLDRRPSELDRASEVVPLLELGEGLATLEELQRRVRVGELVPEDLVDMGQGWQSIEDVVPFDDACDAYRRRGRVVYYVWSVIGLLLLAGIILVYRASQGY